MSETINWENIQPAELKGGFAIQDVEITQSLTQHLSGYNWQSFLKNDGRLDELQKEYIDTFKTWIESSTNNNVKLGPFTHATITNGTSESFQMFMQRHNHRTFRFRQGEFMMHKITANNMNLDWGYLWNHLDLNELTEHDAMIISLPYSNTCYWDSNMSLKGMLTNCNKLNIPVLLDLAYFGTTTNIELDLNDPMFDCVEDVVFSLGKTFPLIGARPGIRFQRSITDDAVFFANQHGIVNNFSCVAGLYAMTHYSADYIYNKYKETAELIAKNLNAELSMSVLFAASSDSRYDSIKRVDYELTRLCLSNLITRIYND